ncbi:MAG: hypothetical protein A3H69_01030 [Candidatus Sungbacteria bacterium RIFCSPLOWO2_02_FULL_47_9]|uniref:Uncharacterized protein n=1 Tax=Candidatus Sungbacteria bacterium RIFCSPHIGHO2_01_FULL_47_32 TaxID=1802264 RepID=A0A1G2K3A3_9BACT|nr:MAG: hypothetical protein UX72_C0001G0151 [Parcubacteria group bacterium GW2011_GWA2_47_10]OGZ93902.1 MAG: hypothetical protein A2633_05300 [Candidatus Sungbacteria bacterium RIFCSPHIGHO2_01_FULL_47_32]OGZ99154.1 MAG: hypothetical protein A3D57_05350 [Candidatus Sungbacteria bacterium RIFCSPHIGHO2_02_FULL_46_12]OHA06030.1 MAG: hypothetical protein A3A28_05360 [Candidatus Sungbacteria bacterium RIFCSPLOWO2_01_FULL_47_32]OHA09317.1 MAG: hypothetical protein A3H69_01030 [Candidatus Sungbacteria
MGYEGQNFNEPPPLTSRSKEELFKLFSAEEIETVRRMVSEEVMKNLRGETPLRGVELSGEERTLLSKMSSEIRKAARNNEELERQGRQTVVSVEFNLTPESQAVWQGLIDKMSLPMLRANAEHKPEKASAKPPLSPIEKAFLQAGETARKGAKEKFREYDERIRAAMKGTPLKPGDTVEGLKKDFRFFTRKEWDEGFKGD